MTQYVVTKNFQDRLTRKYYSIGSTYNTDNQERATELELGGYIAPDNTEMASMAKAEAQANQASTKNVEQLASVHAEIRENAQPKTVVNGKVVPLNVAQMAEASFNATNSSTGVQDHHSNASEAVQAGQVAQQQQAQSATHSATATGSAQSAQSALSAQAQAEAQAKIKQANVQSAQSHMEEHVQSAEQLSQQMKQAEAQRANAQGSQTASGQQAGASQMYNQGGYTQADYNQEAQNKGTAQTANTAQSAQAEASALRAEISGNAMAAEHEEASFSATEATKKATGKAKKQ